MILDPNGDPATRCTQPATTIHLRARHETVETCDLHKNAGGYYVSKDSRD